jgi:hypothetical protein
VSPKKGLENFQEYEAILVTAIFEICPLPMRVMEKKFTCKLRK